MKSEFSFSFALVPFNSYVCVRTHMRDACQKPYSANTHSVDKKEQADQLGTDILSHAD